MNSEYILKMRFKTTQDKIHTITLNEAKIDADEDAGMVMDQIIDDNIFTTNSGDLASKASVVLSIKDYTLIEL